MVEVIVKWHKRACNTVCHKVGQTHVNACDVMRRLAGGEGGTEEDDVRCYCYVANAVAGCGKAATDYMRVVVVVMTMYAFK